MPVKWTSEGKCHWCGKEALEFKIPYNGVVWPICVPCLDKQKSTGVEPIIA